jgi:SAM-dependent methyltransferase
VNLSDVVPTDLVVMSHVLEHISDPIKFIQIATSGLRQGGALFIEVPCRDWEHKDLDEPHILFFDKRPLQLLLQRAGFNDIEVSYQTSFKDHGVPWRQKYTQDVILDMTPYSGDVTIDIYDLDGPIATGLTVEQF